MTRSCSCGFQDYLCCCKSPEYEPLQWGTGQTLVKILFPIISWKELCNMVQFIRKKKRQELFQMNPLFFPTLDKYNEFQLTLLLICVFPIFPTICINFIPGNLLTGTGTGTELQELNCIL